MGRDLPFFEDVADLARSAVAVAELRSVLPSLSEALTPASRADIVRELAELKLLYGLGEKRSEAEWRSIWGRYVDALRHVPLAALKAGIADHVAQPDARYFPLPGPLKTLCDRHCVPAAAALMKARRVIAVADTHEAEERVKGPRRPADPDLVRRLSVETAAFAERRRGEASAKRRESPAEMAARVRQAAEAPQ